MNAEHKQQQQQQAEKECVGEPESKSSSICSLVNIFFILANVFFIIGLLMIYALPPIISSVIDQQIALTPKSKSFPMWKEPPVPIYQKFYFFNVTNAQEIEQFGHKPQLEEIGPFTYRTDWDKRDIDIDNLQNTISFKHFKTWHFEPELSVADDRLQIVTLNAPLAITLTLIQSASNAVRLLVTFSLDGLSEGFFTKRTVKQLLFDGYPDLLTTFGPLLNADMLSQGGHFGYMNARNNSQDGQYEINSGADTVQKLNTIAKLNGRTKLPYWRNNNNGQQQDFCNSLEGATTGEMFPPIVDGPSDGSNKVNSIKLFQPDFCRTWRLDFESDVEHSSGLRLKRFKATRDIFKNSTELPENSCFFPEPRGGASSRNSVANRQRQARQLAGGAQSQQQPNRQHHHGRTRVRHEWPSGVFTLAPCKFNAPIYMSMPHFLDADPYYNSHVGGLAPDPDKHDFSIDLEPRTGAPIRLSARVQINVAISKPPGLVRFRNVPEIMFPVFWQELSVNLTGPTLDQLMLAARGAQEINLRISYGFLVLGIAILSLSGIIYLYHKIACYSKQGKYIPETN